MTHSFCHETPNRNGSGGLRQCVISIACYLGIRKLWLVVQQVQIRMLTGVIVIVAVV